MSAGTDYSASFYDNLAKDDGVIENIANDFPYSSLAQYLRLYNSRKKGDAGFEKLLKKTALYFNNPHWLQFQLSQLDNENGNHISYLHHGSTTTTGEETVVNHFAIATDEQLEELPATISVDNEELETELTSNNWEGADVGQHVNEIESAEAKEEESHNNFQEEIISQEGDEIEEVIAEPTVIEENNFQNLNVVEEREPLPHTEHLGSDIEHIITETAETNGSLEVHDQSTREPLTENITQAGDHDTLPGDLHIVPAEKDLKTESNDIAIENSQGDLTHDTPIHLETTTGTSKDEKPVLENENAIAFEPLHTVDYFASQGIKITDEALSKDKLGTQMKSFTEWLKSMKKLHATPLPEQNTLAEDIIQSAAEVSNIDTEVLTEAMAEVLIKQDKKEKAIEMYNKLSLINPSKSAYFAAKIESIKST